MSALGDWWSSASSRRRGVMFAAGATLALASVGLVGPSVSAQSGLTITAGVGEGTVAGQAFMPGDVTRAHRADQPGRSESPPR